MNSNVVLPGLKGIEITKFEETNVGIMIHLEIPRKSHHCPSCGQ